MVVKEIRHIVRGLQYDLEFLFSVWESEATERLNVYYRGICRSVEPGSGVTVIPLDELPFERLGNDDTRLLKRYREENKRFRFSVYSGTSKSGERWDLGPQPAA